MVAEVERDWSNVGAKILSKQGKTAWMTSEARPAPESSHPCLQ